MPKTLNECRKIALSTLPRINALRELLDSGAISDDEMVSLVSCCFPPNYREILHHVLGINDVERKSFDKAYLAVALTGISRHRFDKIVGSKSLQRILNVLASDNPDKNPLLGSPSSKRDSHFARWCQDIAALACKCPVSLNGEGIVHFALHEIAVSASSGAPVHAFFTGGRNRLTLRQFKRLMRELPSYGFSLALHELPASDGSILTVRW